MYSFPVFPVITPAKTVLSFFISSKDLTKTEKKHLSIEKAKELFPSVAGELTASKDGRAEALLIALYGKDLWQTKQSTLKTR